MNDPSSGARYRELGYWREELLTHRIFDHARRWPDRTAVIDGQTRLSWSDLSTKALSAAGTLRDRNVTQYDVVSTQLPNGIDIIVMHLAIELLGAIHNPLAIQFREHELNQIAELLGSKMVVHPGFLDGIDYGAIHARTAAGHSGKAVDIGEFGGFEATVSNPVTSPAKASDGAFILNTSGTVAIKGVLHSHEDAMYSTRVVAEMIGFNDDDKVICAIPMTWGGGLAWGVRFALHHGSTLICISKWDPVRTAEIIDAEGGSYIYGPPTLARDLVGLAPEWRPRVPLKMICAGAPIPRQLCRDAKDMLGMRLFPGYGQTEHLHSTLGRLSDSEEKIFNTDGSALPGVEVHAVDDNGIPCKPGEVGNIECRGPNVSREYFNQPDLSASTFRPDGWQITQDLGAFDQEGYLRVGGRKRDIIIRGGLNVSPREVEELLSRHPDVKEAAVVGYADPRYGERICAFIVPEGGVTPSVEELSQVLAEMGVARYKYPERVEAIDALPLTTTGKVRHEALREILQS